MDSTARITYDAFPMINSHRMSLASEDMIDTIIRHVKTRPHDTVANIFEIVKEAVISYCPFLYQPLTGALEGRLEQELEHCVSPGERIASITRSLKIATAYVHLDRTMQDKDRVRDIAEATIQRPSGRGFVHLPFRGEINPVLQEMEKDYDVEKVGWSNRGYYATHRTRESGNWRFPQTLDDTAYIKQASSMVTIGLLSKALARDIRFVIDMCAAPGGKSIELAAALYDRNATIFCNDISTQRMDVMKKILSKHDIERANVRITFDTLDGSKIGDRMENSADIVVCDAPCRGPEISTNRVSVFWRLISTAKRVL